MKTLICAALLTSLPVILHAQLLNGDEQFPVLNQIRWDMTRETILHLCASEKLKIGGNDTTITFEAKLLGVEAKTFVRFKSKAERPWGIDVKFKELSEKLVDTLASHITRITGELPRKAAKEKNLILMTMRMEIAAWKTKTDRISLMVGRQNKSIFDINLSLMPVSQ